MHIHKSMKAKIRYSITLPLLAALILLSPRPAHTLLALSAASIHELGHLLAALRLNIPISSLTFELLGARININGQLCSYRDETLLCLAGPAANAVCGILSLISIAFFGEHELIAFFSVASFSLCFLNLLPIRSFDGGRVLGCILCRFSAPRCADATLDILSFICCFLLWCISVYMLLRAGVSLSLFIFSVSLFSRLFILK